MPGGTLRASLSGTFLQTLPDLVTPLKEALFVYAQLSTDTVSALRKIWVLDHTPCIAFRHLPPRKDVANQCLEFVLGVMYQIYNGLVQCPNIKTKLVPPASADHSVPAERIENRTRNSEAGCSSPSLESDWGYHSTIFSRYFTERLLQIW